MSKKKLFNLIEFLVHIPLLAIMFILPYVELSAGTGFPEIIAPLGTYTLFGYLRQFPNGVLTAFIVLIVLNAFICLSSVFMKTQKKDGVIHTIIPIIFFLIGAIFYAAAYEPGYDISIYASGKNIVLVLMAVIIVLSFLKRSHFVFPKDDAPAVIVEQKNISTADELKKYQELLNSGAITQEEFDAKKKQLLNL